MIILLTEWYIKTIDHTYPLVKLRQSMTLFI